MGLAAFVRAVQLLAGLPLLLFPLYRILRISKSMTSIGMCVGGCVIIMSLLTTDFFFCQSGLPKMRETRATIDSLDQATLLLQLDDQRLQFFYSPLSPYMFQWIRSGKTLYGREEALFAESFNATLLKNSFISGIRFWRPTPPPQ